MVLTTLKSKIVLYFSGLAVCLIILGGTLWRIADIRSQLIVGNEQRAELGALVHELRRTADDLTRMAQTYVVTGDPTFKQYYQEILAIRDGQRPRPQDYDNLYWDLALINKQRPDSDGPAIALSDLIRKHPLTQSEQGLLAQVEQHSHHINELENRAMTLAESDRRPQGFALGPHRDSAFILLYEQPYAFAKTSLVNSIAAFITSVDERAQSYASQGRQHVKTLSDFMLFMAVFTLLYAAGGWWLFSRVIARPLSTLLSSIGQRIPIEDQERGNTRTNQGEIEALASVYEDLLHKLATGMQNLKHANEQLSQHSEELSVANRTLAARTSLLDATLSHISQGVSVFDRHARLLTWNDRFLALYGFDPALIRAGLPVEAVIDAVPRNTPGAKVARQEWIDRIRSMQPFSLEETLSDGRVFEIQSTVTPDQRLVVTQSDISERKAIERVKNEFVSTVSHELRTPLTSIAGSLGLLAGGGAGPLPDRVAKLITIAYNNSQRLVRLVNDILDLEKLDAGKMVLKVIPTSILQVVEQCIESSKGYADSFNVRLRLAPNAADGTVNGDPDRLAQVFVNLLSNATKFSPLGGIVDVQVVRMGENIRISVRDYGRGIPPEFRSAIFSKFAQADGSDRRQRGGTGLGLNIAKSIVEQHGGQITFESEVGKGTQFIVELPLWLAGEDGANDILNAVTTSGNGKDDSGASSHVVAELQHYAKHGRTTLRILHVEDDADIQAVVKASLEGIAQVTSTGSLAAARAVLTNASFDLVILDLQLPDGSGLELLPLRRNHNGQLTPTIIFSVEETDPPAVLQVVTVLTKSRVSIDELVHKVKSLLSRQQVELAAQDAGE